MNKYIAYCGLDCEAERRGDHAGNDQLHRLPDSGSEESLL